MDIFEFNEKDLLFGKRRAACAVLIGCSTALLYFLLGPTSEFAIYCTLLNFSMLLAFCDIATHEVPDLVLAVMAVFGIFLIPFNPFILWYTSVAGALAVGGGLMLLAHVSKGQMGMGDGKLFVVIGIYLGLKGAAGVLLYSLVLGGIAGLILIAFRRVSRKTAMPFVPFIAVGIVIELLLKF